MLGFENMTQTLEWLEFDWSKDDGPSLKDETKTQAPLCVSCVDHATTPMFNKNCLLGITLGPDSRFQKQS